MKTLLLIAFTFCATTTFAQTESGSSSAVEHSVKNINGKHPNTIRNQDAAVTLKVYPIPADKYINIYVTCKQPKDITLRIYDKDEKQLQEIKADAQTSYEKSVDITKLPDGKYNVKLFFDHGQLRQSFTVKHG
jgi:hypothetical protein